MEWNTYIEELGTLANALLAVRISDNVLDDEDWRVDVIKFSKGKVVSQTTVYDGAYDVPNMVGWSLIDFKDWSSEDWTGSHPEIYNEHFILFK